MIISSGTEFADRRDPVRGARSRRREPARSYPRAGHHHADLGVAESLYRPETPDAFRAAVQAPREQPCGRRGAPRLLDAPQPRGQGGSGIISSIERDTAWTDSAPMDEV